jgi:multidrug efflux pump subunit AcrA (membrane-fusion protein)
MLVTNETPTEKYGLGLVQQLNLAEKKNKELQAELDRLQAKLAAEQTARRSAIAVLETKYADVQQRLAQKEAELQNLQSTESRAAEALRTAEANVEALRNEVVGLRAEIQKAQTDRDMQFDKVVVLTDHLHAAKGLQQQLEARQKQLLAEISNNKRIMDKLGIRADMDTEHIATPNLDGIVLRVGPNNLILVSLGEDEGLKVGHRLELVRGSEYLGYAIVRKTEPDKAVAEVDSKSQKGMIKENDVVKTKIGRTAS